MKRKLRIESYETGVTKWELRIKSYESKITKRELQTERYEVGCLQSTAGGSSYDERAPQRERHHT
jgi:hypothetical protein